MGARLGGCASGRPFFGGIHGQSFRRRARASRTIAHGSGSCLARRNDRQNAAQEAPHDVAVDVPAPVVPLEVEGAVREA